MNTEMGFGRNVDYVTPSQPFSYRNREYCDPGRTRTPSAASRWGLVKIRRDCPSDPWEELCDEAPFADSKMSYSNECRSVLGE